MAWNFAICLFIISPYPSFNRVHLAWMENLWVSSYMFLFFCFNRCFKWLKLMLLPFCPLRVYQVLKEARYTSTHLLSRSAFLITHIYYTEITHSHRLSICESSLWDRWRFAIPHQSSLMFLWDHCRRVKCPRKPSCFLFRLLSHPRAQGHGGVMAQLEQVLKSPPHFTSESYPSTCPCSPAALQDTPRCSVETGEAERMGYTPVRMEFITFNGGSLKTHYSAPRPLCQPLSLVAPPDESAASHLLKCKLLPGIMRAVWTVPLHTPLDHLWFLLKETSSWVCP